MAWSEGDLEKALWTIPPERMKGGAAHEVPRRKRPSTFSNPCRAGMAILSFQRPAASGRYPASAG
jgi:hypothetical protein